MNPARPYPQLPEALALVTGEDRVRFRTWLAEVGFGCLELVPTDEGYRSKPRWPTAAPLDLEFPWSSPSEAYEAAAARGLLPDAWVGAGDRGALERRSSSRKLGEHKYPLAPMTVSSLYISR